MVLSEIESRIRRAERDSDREPGRVTLIAVSKVQPVERVLHVLEAGHRVFGENRVQEAEGRWLPLREQFQGIRLHLIGPLQTNKVKAAVALFDVIETIDRERLAIKVSEEIRAQAKPLSLFIQVNTGEEPQKAGIAPKDLKDFLDFCREEQGLAIEGLMAIPPADEPPAPHFALLAKLAKEQGLRGLSMGMSGDFETAIAMGATQVRVGSALFGARTS